jgi:hypothetical protein
MSLMSHTDVWRRSSEFSHSLHEKRLRGMALENERLTDMLQERTGAEATRNGLCPFSDLVASFIHKALCNSAPVSTPQVARN